MGNLQGTEHLCSPLAAFDYKMQDLRGKDDLYKKITIDF